MRTVRTATSLLAGACLGIASCAVDAAEEAPEVQAPAMPERAEQQAEAQAQPVSLQFKAVVGSEPLACGKSYAALGTKAGGAQLRDFRFFVSGVRLIADDGREVPVALDERDDWQTAELALLDFADSAGQCSLGDAGTNLTVTGTVPAGRYRGVVFVNGVPEKLNHADPTFAPAPLAQPGVSWNWLLGYKFLIAEVVRDEAIARTAAAAGGHAVAPAASGHAPTPPAAAGHTPTASASGSSTMGSGGMMNMETPGVGALHLGSTACSGSPAFGISCSRINRNEVRLEGFDPAKNTIVADLSVIFAKSDLAAGASCHSGGASCGPMFEAVGVDFESGSALKTQSVFRVE